MKTTTTFSKRDLEDFLKNCSSINKKGEIHPRAILDGRGNAIPASEYMHRIGARKLRQTPDFSKSFGEKEKIKKAKAEFKADMRSVFGVQWKRVSKTLGYRNPPVGMEARKLVRKEATLLNDQIL